MSSSFRSVSNNIESYTYMYSDCQYTSNVPSSTVHWPACEIVPPSVPASQTISPSDGIVDLLPYEEHRCYISDRCTKRHSTLPYKWIIQIKDSWRFLWEENEEIERTFCDPNNFDYCSRKHTLNVSIYNTMECLYIVSK